MSYAVVLRPFADADVRQIYADYEAKKPGLGDQFLFRLQEVLSRIETMPEIYAEV